MPRNVGHSGKISPRPLTNASQQKTTRKMALTTATRQLNSKLAMLLPTTSRKIDRYRPRGRSNRPNSTTEPVMMNRILKSKRSTVVAVALGESAPSATTAPSTARQMPSQKGKYPGPIRAAVPMLYWVAPKANPNPIRANITPDQKSCLFLSCIEGLRIVPCQVGRPVRRRRRAEGRERLGHETYKKNMARRSEPYRVLQASGH